MNKLVWLYILNMMTVSGSGVGRVALASAVGMSTNTLDARLDNLVKNELVVKERVLIGIGRGYKYLYGLTEDGRAELAQDYELARDAYRVWNDARTFELLTGIKLGKNGRKKKPVNTRQIDMFGE